VGNSSIWETCMKPKRWFLTPPGSQRRLLGPAATLAVLIVVAAGCSSARSRCGWVIHDLHYNDYKSGWNSWVSKSEATVYPCRMLAEIAAEEYRNSIRAQAWYGGGDRIACIAVEKLP
jgi:hypothetical protein